MVDPDALLPHLLSHDDQERSAAFKSIGLELMAEMELRDIRLFAINIDSDDDLERVLVLNNSWVAAAVVLKRENDAWWELGSFLCCGPGSAINNLFVELRQTVEYGTNDVVVHAGGKLGTAWANGDSSFIGCGEAISIKCWISSRTPTISAGPNTRACRIPMPTLPLRRG